MSFEKRKNLYQEIKAELNEYGTEEIKIIEKNSNNEYEINSEQEIINLLKKVHREKILFRIKNITEGYLNNNRIVLIKGKYIKITNPFILFAEGAFPEVVDVNFEEDGVDYSFKLSKFKSHGNEREIYCEMPKNIKVLKRRGQHRVKATINVPVGLYNSENSKEYIGTLNDISESGIGIKFDSCYFDIDFFSSLKQEDKPRASIIIETNGEYLPVVISIKFLNKNDKDEIFVGAEFVLTEEKKNEQINKFVDELRKYAIFQKKKELSEHLIFTGEMGG